MAWQPRQSNGFYRCLIYTGMILRGLFRIRILVSGSQNLPAPDPLAHGSRSARPGHGAVVVLTHFGYLDFAFAEIILWKHMKAHLRFLITQRAAAHPVAGPLISVCGHVVVNRKKGKGAYEDAVRKLREGEYVAVLPEAGVSRSFTVRECKTGAVRMASEAQVPIIPISVWGSHRIMSRGHGLSLRRTWRAPVRAHIGEPMVLGAQVDAVQGTERLRRALQRGIDTAQADLPLPPARGAWWLPAHLGGGAPTIEEQRRLDALDAD